MFPGALAGPPHTSSSNFLMACTWIPAGRTKWTNTKFPSPLRVPDPKLCSYTTGILQIYTAEIHDILYSYNYSLPLSPSPPPPKPPCVHARNHTTCRIQPTLTNQSVFITPKRVSSRIKVFARTKRRKVFKIFGSN